MSLNVLHAPLHAPSAARHPAAVTREIRKHDATMVGLTEAYSILTHLGKMRGYRLVVEDGGKDRRGAEGQPHPPPERDAVAGLRPRSSAATPPRP